MGLTLQRPQWVKQDSDRKDVIYIFEKITACGRKAWTDQMRKQGTHWETVVPRARR